MVLQNEKSSRKGSTPPNGTVRSVGSVHIGGGGDGGGCSIHGGPESSSDDSAMSTSSSPTSSTASSSASSSSVSSASSTAGGGGGGSGGSGGGGGGNGSGSGSGTSSGGERVSHEQPVIKRQRIENESTASATSGGSAGASGGGGSTGASKDSTSASCSSVASSASSSSISLASSPSSSSTKLVSDPSSSDEELQQMKQVTDYQMAFQEAIAKQCLCGVDTHVLLKSFQAYHTYSSRSGSSNDSTKGSIGSIVGRDRKKAPMRQLHPLIDWPFEYLLKFLSNVQLLFDTYLKQNIKGNICSGVMDLCNYLIRSEHQRPETELVSMNIDEIIGLCNYNNKFITYLAGRILSSFLIIIKDDPDDRWLEKIVANLFDFSQLDLLAVRKISFSLDIIKRIVEWKDETEHPLEDETTARSLQQPQPSQAVPSSGGHHQPLHSFTGSSQGSTAGGSYGGSGASTSAQGASMFMVPPLEDNYFVTQYSSHQYAGDPASVIFNTAPSSKGASGAAAPVPASSEVEIGAGSSPVVVGGVHSSHGTTASSFGHLATASCRYITLTDSESFDTTRIKFETISILGNKWTALVKHINQLIRAQAGTATQQNGHSMSVIATETCILTFLRLWESIISVKANLSVVETQPFHSQLDSFQLLLLSTRSSVIYKEMLTLFNEALCYGSTLALQDLIPEEVGSLAHNIVRSVKDYRILDKMPKSTYSNHMGFLGYKGDIVRYQDKRLARQGETCSSYGRNGDASTDTVDATSVVNSSNPYASGSNGGESGMVVPSQPQFHSPQSETCYDRTLMQKMALLVLKAVAVIVKEIRCDSSDSSVDSSEFDMQEIQMIERSIRDVVKKLETFLKIQLEFHPDSHFSKVLIHLFDDQDDYLVEAMVCTLDVTSGISFRNNAFPELIAMLNPVYTFIEFSNLGPNITHLFLDLLISPETCFLLFLLRFLKYIRQNWSMFTQSCLNYYQHNSYSNASTLLQNIRNSNIIINASASSGSNNNIILDSVMTVLISLRLQISRLVADTLFPYNITPILRLIENCESLYEGNELS